jgi:hypothetical protein
VLTGIDPQSASEVGGHARTVMGYKVAFLTGTLGLIALLSSAL